MSTHDDDFLWSGRGVPDAVVTSVRARVAPLAFRDDGRRSWRTGNASLRPLGARGKALAPRSPRRWLLAAALLVATASGWRLLEWRLEWPEGRAWAAGQSAALTLDQARVVETPGLRVAVARLGELRAAVGTRLALRSTGTYLHSVEVERGEIDVRLWSPPGRFRVRTPAGDVIDLGCVFSLSVDEAAVTEVRVVSGWVQLDNGWGESLVPAGASSAMRLGTRPEVPVFGDSDHAFRGAVRAWERASVPPPGRTPPLGVDAAVADAGSLALAQAATRLARPRDVFTLLMLATRATGDARARFTERAALLSPPPAGVSSVAVARGDDGALWVWAEALPLPPVKGWWRNWRDAFPAFGR